MDLEKLKEILTLVPEVITSLVLLATVLVRFTPSKKDDVAVLSLGGKLWKAIQWLPTIGVNPQTKALEQAYLEAKAKLDAIEKAMADKSVEEQKVEAPPA